MLMSYIEALWNVVERSVLMGEKTKEQLLDELAEVQKMLEERTEMQGQMIRKFQLLIANELLISQIIDFFPYPIAIFTLQYRVTMVNRIFASEAKMLVKNSGEQEVRILKHRIEDAQLATAVTRVFEGVISFLEDIKEPFSMFSGIATQIALHPSRFNRAVVFPVPADDEEINHAVIVFMP
jgi:hypothetical protein